MTDTLLPLISQVRAAAQAHTPLRIRAGGTKDFYGNPTHGEILDPRGHTGIVNYEPSELVITARCGTPLADIEAALAANQQMLGFEPPHFGAHATLGGTVAAGLAGPQRAATLGGGAVRDFVLGAQLLTAKGDVLRFGGQVMKNVAGYDMARLLTGSLGTLGVILEVSLKVLPCPRVEETLCLHLHQTRAIQRLNAWAGQPWPISATLWHEGVLHVRLSGSEAAVSEARTTIGGDIVDGTALWTEVREHTHPFFSHSELPMWRLSVPSITPPLDLGPTLIEWGGALRWIHSNAHDKILRTRVSAAGGHATLFRNRQSNDNAFHPLEPALAKIHHRLKTEFDPHGIFNRGRMYATW